PGTATATRVGTAYPAGPGVSVSRWMVVGCGARTAIQDGRPEPQGPTQAVDRRSSKAAEARRLGTPSKRPDDVKAQPRGIPARRSSAGSGAVGLTLAQPLIPKR